MGKLPTIASEHQEKIDELLAATDIPVLTGLQRQGDVLIVPTSERLSKGLATIPAAGVLAVRGEHPHILVGDGAHAWRGQVGSDSLYLGALVVHSVVWMLHDEHGGNAIGPGTYLLQGKREARVEPKRPTNRRPMVDRTIQTRRIVD